MDLKYISFMSYKFKNGYRKYNLHLKFYSGKTFSNIPDQITNIHHAQLQRPTHKIKLP